MIYVTNDEYFIVKNILKKYNNEMKVGVFGSRFRGDFKEYSDLDLVLISNLNEKIDKNTIAKIKEEFEDSDLLYRVDIIDYYNISDEFRNIIDNGYELIKFD